MRAAPTVIALSLFSAFSVAPSGTFAQEHDHVGAPTEAAPFGNPVDDQHVWFHAILDQFEGRLGRDAALRWDSEIWTGTDSDRLWIKSEGKVQDSEFGDGQHEVLYDKPISTYFDVQAGLRYDLDDRKGRGWGALGIEGLAPYFFRVSATAYASDTGHFGAKLIGSYDLLITQRLVLQPEAEINLYTKADPGRLTGSGVSDIDTGLRLRYEITRKFSPYIGVAYEKKFGQSGALAAAAGEKTDALRFTLGVRSWF